MKAFIKAIEYYLPDGILDNEELARDFPEWNAEKIETKTGIRQRHMAAQGECASDMAVAAAKKILASGACQPEDIDYILLCTQSPDYFLPTTACVLQQRLGLPSTCGALDFNLGCSGFVYGLGLAKGLIETDQARNILLVTAETYSKFIHPGDKSVRALFGDAAAATLVSATESEIDLIGPFVYGTDGSGARNLIVPAGGARQPFDPDAPVLDDANGNRRSSNHLFMDGQEIFNFTLQVVPKTVTELLALAGLDMKQIDLWVFHQANRFMLDHLRRKIGVPADRFPINIADCGNTVSSTIPIVLHEQIATHALSSGKTIALIGFGVGYSWAGTILRWR